MNEVKRPINLHQTYHAHVYFDHNSQEVARSLCAKIATLFDFPIGRFHEKLVGPHPMWSCQITFSKNDFDDFVPWLDKHREGLTIFVHGLTGNDWQDHTDYAYWLGESVELNLSIFAQNIRD